MARVVATSFACYSLVALGDRAYSISITNAQKLLCLDPASGQQTTINLGAAAPQLGPVVTSELVASAGDLFVCLQFRNSVHIIKYDPLADTTRTIVVENNHRGSQCGFSKVAELNGNLYLICHAGVWELSTETEATHFFEANLGDCLCDLCAGICDGKLYIFSKGETGVWQLDPAARRLQCLRYRSDCMSWVGTAHCKGRLFAFEQLGDEFAILEFRGVDGKHAKFKVVTRIRGVFRHSFTADGEHIILCSNSEFVFYNVTNGVQQRFALCDYLLFAPFCPDEWDCLCAVSGKLVGLSSGHHFLFMNVATFLAIHAPCEDEPPHASSKEGHDARTSIQKLVADLRKAKATAEAATKSAAGAAVQAKRAKAAVDAAAKAAEDAAAQAVAAAKEVTDAVGAAEAAAEAIAAAESSASTALAAEAVKASAAAATAAAAIEKATREKTEIEANAAWYMMSHLPPGGSEAGAQVWTLPSNDPRHAMISKLLCKSCTLHRQALGDRDFCPPPELVLTEVALVRNPLLAGQYRFTRQQVQGRRSAHPCRQLQPFAHLALPCPDGCEENQLNEVLLFHGAPAETVDEICCEGFDPRRGGEAVGAMFGFGTYFAANASKADIYTDTHPSKLPRGAKRKLIVARVLLGEAYRATSQIPTARRPPDGPDGRPYDSVWADTRANGGAVDHLEAIVYEKGQAVPLLVLTYHHANTCQCAECGKRLA